MIVSCCGYNLLKLFAFANSKSAKSKPGETVQPTKLKLLSGAGSDANQQPAGTTN